MPHDHPHDHDHAHGSELSEIELRVRAIESLLVEKGYVDPRGVLGDFGVKLGEDVEVRVWDSTAEVRYLVLPQRPAGTDGMREEELAKLVTRDSMIGTGLALSPNK